MRTERIKTKYNIAVMNGGALLETIGTPGHPVWGAPMSAHHASNKIGELRRTKRYPAEYNLIPVPVK